MKKLILSEICKVLRIERNASYDTEISQVSNDIKNIGENTLVFHLNKQVELDIANFSKYSTCYVITDQPNLKDPRINSDHFFHVIDVFESYQTFTNYYRNLFKIPVVAITGTCGKTTTKEMIKQILESKYKVAATISNKNNLGYNNDYLFSIDDTINYGVFETAISYPGDLIKGCKLFKPTIGVITNIGIDHLNGCKTMDNYIKTKGEMLAGLKYKGKLIINNDDENIKKIDFSPYKGNIITFGINNSSTYTAKNIEYEEKGMSYVLIYKENPYKVFVPGLGYHNVYNSLAALAVLSELGLYLNESINYLANVKFIRSHMEIHNGVNNSKIIDDTWSSNPTSLKAAIDVLNAIGKDKVKILVLGKISYLGDYAKDEYRKIGKMIVDNNINFLITTDQGSKLIAESAKAYGMNTDFLLHCSDNNHLKKTVEVITDKNSVVLFKVSMLDQNITKAMKQLFRD